MGVHMCSFCHTVKVLLRKGRGPSCVPFLPVNGNDNTLPIFAIYLAQLLGQDHSFTGFILHPASRHWIWLHCLWGSVVWLRDKLPEDCSARQPSLLTSVGFAGEQASMEFWVRSSSLELGFMPGKGQNSPCSHELLENKVFPYIFLKHCKTLSKRVVMTFNPPESLDGGYFWPLWNEGETHWIRNLKKSKAWTRDKESRKKEKKNPTTYRKLFWASDIQSN